MAIPHAIASRSHVVEPTQRACAADRQHGASARRRQLETSRDLYQNPYRSAREVQSKHDLTPRAQRSESTHGSDKGIQNDIVGPHVKDTTAWPQGPSQALRDAGVHIRQLAAIVHAETEHAQKTEPTTEVGRALVAATARHDTIELQPLANVAHKHPQRAISRYLYPHITRISQKRHP